MNKHLDTLREEYVNNLQQQGMSLTPEQSKDLETLMFASYQVGVREQREAYDMYEARVEADM